MTMFDCALDLLADVVGVLILDPSRLRWDKGPDSHGRARQLRPPSLKSHPSARGALTRGRFL